MAVSPIEKKNKKLDRRVERLLLLILEARTAKEILLMSLGWAKTVDRSDILDASVWTIPLRGFAAQD